MTHARRRSITALLLAGAAACLSSTEDARAGDPPAPADPSAKPDAAPKADDKAAPDAAKPAAEDPSDKKARDILAKAAARQNAGDLGEPGKLESFHVVFHRAIFESEKKNERGEVVASEMIETDDDGLVVDWKQGSIKTQITLHGETTTKAWMDWTKSGWFYDGKKVFPLVGDRKSDLDQLQSHRRIVDQMLDVAILGKLLTDKSRWSVVSDAPPREKSVAIRRSKTAEAPDALPIVLWIEDLGDSKYGDVVAAEIPPDESAGGPTLLYDFEYHAEFPTVSRAGADGVAAKTAMRFPFKVNVYESSGDEKSRRKVLFVATDSVSINSVSKSDFAPPKQR